MRIIILLYSLLITACLNTVDISDKSLINTDHLDHNLYKEMVGSEDTSAFVYIYAEYPAYKPFEATGEGIACIDDVARAAIFYFRYFKQTQDNKYLVKAKNLTTFILNMQADNGMFYNFITADYSINKTHKNSLAIADWWTWRALWALSEAMIYAKQNEPQYYILLNKAFTKTIDSLAIANDINNILASLAADQASVFLIALAEYSKVSSDKMYLDYVLQLSQNIISKQKGNEENFPYYAFMSWRNVWHGWGNTQAYALLKAADVTGDKELLYAAANEVKYFYNYVLSKNHFKQFVLNKSEQDSQFESFEQIAYAIRPMVWASLELYNQTGEKQFAKQAGKLAAWFTGENVTRQAIYDHETGRCYDGINSADKINLNSGAESTIEALLTLIEIEQNPIARDYLKSSFRKYSK